MVGYYDASIVSRFGWYFSTFTFETYPYTMSNRIILTRQMGLDIVYCNYDVWSAHSGLLTWAIPFQNVVWAVFIPIVILIVVSSSVVYCLSMNIKFNAILHAIVDSFFQIFASLFRQGISNGPVNKSNCILMVLLFFSFVLMAHYEFFLTVTLISPPQYRPYTTMQDMLNAGFHFTYRINDNTEHIVYRESIAQDLNAWSMPSYPNRINVTNSSAVEMADKHLNPTTSKHGILLQNHDVQPVLLRKLQNVYNCYRIENVCMIKTFSDIVDSPFYSKFKRTVTFLEQSGIILQWELYFDYGKTVIYFRENSKALASYNKDYITYHHLLSIFQLYMVLILTSLVAMALENRYIIASWGHVMINS